MQIQAPAKLNLTLEVLGPRPDGYHETASIMQTLDLADAITVEPSDDLAVTCSNPSLNGDANLAMRAADLLRREAGDPTAGARIRIEKRIPIAAGLGGGSSDAAATLNALNRLWNLDLSNDRLRAIAAKLGSDVPFLIEGGTAIALGRGERVRHIPTPPNLPSFVLAIPKLDMPDKTATMYRALTPQNFTRGGLTRKLEARIRGGGDVPPQLLFNAFDDAARAAIPEVERCWADLRAAGAREIHLAGSGPTIYAAIDRKEIATTIHLVMDRIKGWQSTIARAAA